MYYRTARKVGSLSIICDYTDPGFLDKVSNLICKTEYVDIFERDQYNYEIKMGTKMRRIWSQRIEGASSILDL